MGLDLSKMRAKAEAEKKKGEKKESENSKYFWKSPEPSGDEKQSKTKVRMVLPPDGDPLRLLWFHYGLKGTGTVLCPKKNDGHKCAICDWASKLWFEGEQEAAKKLFAKDRYYTPVLVRKEEDKGVRWFNLNKTNHNKILYDLMLDEDFQEGITKDITDPVKGIDLVVKKERPAQGQQYGKVTVDPDPAGVTPLCPPKEVDALLATLKPLDELWAKKTSAEVQEILNLHVDGSSETEMGGSSSEETGEEGMSLNDLAKEIEGD